MKPFLGVTVKRNIRYGRCWWNMQLFQNISPQVTRILMFLLLSCVAMFVYSISFMRICVLYTHILIKWFHWHFEGFVPTNPCQALWIFVGIFYGVLYNGFRFECVAYLKWNLSFTFRTFVKRFLFTIILFYL